MIYRPTSADDVAAIVRNAVVDGHKLEIVGGGSHAQFGHPDRNAQIISTAQLSGIVDYDAAELILTVRAGTPLTEIEAAIGDRRQSLLFEPTCSGSATIGGVIAAGVSGSRRVSAGATRDYLLGFAAVSGRGQRFVAGGKVVKNVTGYDVSKLMCGSWGRLAVLTEVTLKVMPAPQERRTLVWQGVDPKAAWRLMGHAMRLPASIAAAAYLPDAQGAVLIRIEGVGPSVEARTRLIGSALVSYGSPTRHDGEQSNTSWRSLDAAAALADAPMLWRLSVGRSAGLAAAVALTELGGRWIADWAGGLIWFAPDDGDSVYGDTVRDIATRARGHATLIRASVAQRRSIAALHPEAPDVAAVSARVRAAFDPSSIFETGRFRDHSSAD